MTERDMRRLESAIGQTLPPAIRRFFLNFPPELRDVEADPDGDEFTLSDDPDHLIEINMPGRHYYQPVDWTPNMFLLGAGGSGETFWVDLNSKSGAVYRFDAGQQGQDSDDIADSLEQFARVMLGEDE